MLKSVCGAAIVLARTIVEPLLPYGASARVDEAPFALTLSRLPVAPRVLFLREPGRMALLTACTFGVYGIYWLYRIIGELRMATGDRSLSPRRIVILTLLTGSLFAQIKLRQLHTQMREWLGDSEASNLPFLWAFIPGLGILMLVYWFQGRINRLAEAAAVGHGHPEILSRPPWEDRA